MTKINARVNVIYLQRETKTEKVKIFNIKSVNNAINNSIKYIYKLNVNSECK